ncbi:MAG: hypothetical protein ABJF50_20535 [Paracoccaceae bacterium]|uniref:hypothetical protein n=1 Tax=Alphaproteobacteria TaxID=28211 RepID=UPI00328FEC50
MDKDTEKLLALTMPITLKKPKARWHYSAIFSLLIFISLIAFYGAGSHLILITPFIIALANIFFIKWPVGSAMDVLRDTATKSIFFSAAAFLASIFWVKSLNSGQIGYGEYMQIDGSNITLLGYATIAKWSGFLGVLVFGSAVITTVIFSRRAKNGTIV